MITQQQLHPGQHYRTPEGKTWVLLELGSGGHSNTFVSPEAFAKGINEKLRYLPNAARGDLWEYANLNRMNVDGWVPIPVGLPAPGKP